MGEALVGKGGGEMVWISGDVDSYAKAGKVMNRDWASVGIGYDDSATTLITFGRSFFIHPKT